MTVVFYASNMILAAAITLILAFAVGIFSSRDRG